MIQVIQLKGKDKHLYQLLAPLVMDPDVIRANNNYPFKTSVHHKWLVATEKGVVKGFMPIDIKSTGACIDNYYVSGGNSLLLSALIDFAKKEFAGEQPLFAVSHTRDAETFKTNGFIVSKEWKLYIKMVYPPTYENKKKCV